ncbi:DUF805 domain-containing protein [Pseudomonas silensiensis]|uniref:DUF805 domain-containing protein n=1 Tax=Pseudomonas silensiensis TaxID=2991049 RepID=UPI003D261BC5
MKWYLQAFKKYATFGGRASRKEFWMFFLIDNCLIALWLGIGIWLGLLGERAYLLIYTAYALCSACPRLAITWRRYHDLNKSGLNFFWLIIPLIGFIMFLISMGTRGNKGENDYGADPKESQVVHG